MEKKHFFDRPRNVKFFFVFFYVVLAVSLAAELFIHRHAYFPWEEHFFFYAAFGFAAFVLLILAAKYILRPLVKRREDYYE